MKHDETVVEITDTVISAQYEELTKIEQEIERMESVAPSDSQEYEEEEQRFTDLKNRQDVLMRTLDGQSTKSSVIVNSKTKQRLQTIATMKPRLSPEHREPFALAEYRRQAKETLHLHDYYDNDKGLSFTSDMDVKIATNMLTLGYEVYAVKNAIAEASPLESLRNDKSYVKSVMETAMQSPEVKKHHRHKTLSLTIEQ